MLILANHESQMLAIVFAGKLVEQSKHRDAATVLEQYVQVNSVLPFYSHPPTHTCQVITSHLYLSNGENERNCGYLGNPEVVFPLKIFRLAYLTWKSKLGNLNSVFL